MAVDMSRLTKARQLWPKQTANLPLMRDWLEHAEATRQIVQHNYGKLKGTARLEVAIQEHVLVQIENLQTHPSVLSRLLKGDLTLHAWVYDLASGAVHTFSTERGEFVPVGSSAS
jgi:carbonic anhydrase